MSSTANLVSFENIFGHVTGKSADGMMMHFCEKTTTCVANMRSCSKTWRKTFHGHESLWADGPTQSIYGSETAGA